MACANSKANEFSQTALWEEVTGVDIEWFGWDDEQVNMALSSKTLPDAFYGTTAIDKAKAYEYGEAGIFVNFADYMDIMPNFSAMLERFPELASWWKTPMEAFILCRVLVPLPPPTAICCISAPI